MSGVEGAHFRRAAIRRKFGATTVVSHGAVPTCPAGPPLGAATRRTPAGCAAALGVGIEDVSRKSAQCRKKYLLT
ncbi:hypothetical protein AV530_010886 [Patagioenas fasciata monilis]|uniref:Uncharacterized protein n=1 Tax=Patagioenas fasciata monilis TaxID=372326 RepID=A0A1V4K846_PATFA|nr:hypothetical protein AV530_010886 [Patagioenas fasciata monilis]